MKRFFLLLDTTDLVNIVFFCILTAGMLACTDRIPHWGLFCIVNCAVILAVFLLANFASTRAHIWQLLHGFYMTAGIPIAFKEVYYLVPALNPVDYDTALIAIDYHIFGVNPTQWLHQYSHPLITEVLQLAYASFYLLPFILIVDLYRKKRMQAFKTVFLAMILGFYLSYFGYLAVPATGPRFTLHSFQTINEELPGVFLTKFLRAYTDFGEGISPEMPDAQQKVQRDVFPSGHTLITLLVMFFAFRYRARLRWLLFTAGSLLIISTVYLRYHYVIDLIAGAASAVVTFYVMNLMDSRWNRFKKSRQGDMNTVEIEGG